ncbi:hypothetical protein TVAG_029260 [Trichomonas vaginalis G3]|uniref:DNA polymerase alpha/delta/epsilon subunit B domain-containing protein n=1 Tax=Trichomonas vaginalis (strain ATCC PRA-98 / G3) TaxID=412133 RepID=A2F518_TRIV3|nr:DNA polymerase delta family [Trichomonas vaginalis G3]EAY00022.1 hypothetical protein TVAG_029260 [Trichomonas vaginalis G3]KAI5523523.1 DNA polymerase delta family [Trichomonas vaginalis G3]|eukprot:XP_001312951.1 hypothetical protein [Trichomonas vaginalis G3]
MSYQNYYVFYQKKLDYARSKLMNQLELPFLFSLQDAPKNTRFSIVGFIHIDGNDKYPEINFKNDQSRNGRQIYLEDSSGRVRLIGDFPFPIASNICVGTTGVLTLEGNLLFDKIMLMPKLLISNSIVHPQVKIALVSNLCLGSKNFDLNSGNKLIEFLKSCDLCIIIGSIMDSNDFPEFANAENDWKEWVELIDPSLIENFHSFFGEIDTRCILIPGFGDPTESVIPIQPFNPAFISPLNMECTTNPGLINIDGMKLLGMTGNIIDKIDCDQLSFHERQKMILSWRYIAPSSPTRIPCEVCEKDILSLDFMPQVFVAGGSQNLEYSMADDTLVISIPDYITSHSAALLNAEYNEVSIINLMD